MKIKIYISILSCLFVIANYGQTDSLLINYKNLKDSLYVKEVLNSLQNEISNLKMQVNINKPLKFFASAGINYRIGANYNVSISPIDKIVRFQEVSHLASGISTGIVWSPFMFHRKKYIFKDKTKDWYYETLRHPLSFALLINILKISYSEEQSKNTIPIDVGFGVGYRKSNLLILFTVELTPIRQPRDFFIEKYKDKNKTLIFLNNPDPVDAISIDNNDLFLTKLYVSLGLKVAYSFTAK